MEIIKRNINNIPVTYFKTNKFKSVQGSLFFKMPAEEGKETILSLLSLIMVSVCKKYDTNKKLNLNLFENYASYYCSEIRRIGNYDIINYNFSCINDKYVNDNVIDNVVDTFCELIYNPDVSNKMFNKESFDLYFNSVRGKLGRIKENRKKYGYQMLMKKMFPNSSISSFKNMDDLLKISADDLYKEYLYIMNNSNLELYLIGDLDYEKVANKILNNLKSVSYTNPKLNENKKEEKEFKVYKETLNTSGSVMFLGTKLLDITPYERSFVIPIYSNILGGGPSSRCFDIIREKNSLAYYCYSKYAKDNLTITLIAGIDGDNFDKTKKLMLEVMDGMKNITDEELVRAKTDIITSLKQIEDDKSSVVSYNYFSDFYEDGSVSEKINNFNKVTKDDVIKICDKLSLDTIYLLEGEK